ncbi:hypothetical protein [Bradyrhizobium yuanmingense]|nr:hypothetical protein [Bradyrhizobium yuanmingense]MDF0497254.1 hypothetical protein [Bradyrhizobium yuanmingense]MDF0521064.1 hypothetical protein [Bradyrhizobium yuanmingense]
MTCSIDVGSRIRDAYPTTKGWPILPTTKPASNVNAAALHRH